MSESSSIHNCTEDPNGILRLKADDGLDQVHPQSSSSSSSSTSKSPHKSYPLAVAITPSASTLCRKRKSNMSMSPSQIDSSSCADTFTDSEVQTLSPTSLSSMNVVSSNRNVGNEDMNMSSIALPFMSTQHRPQPRRVSMCGSSLKKARSYSPPREANVTSELESTFDPNAFKQLLLQRTIAALKNLSYKPGKKTMAKIILDLPNEAAAMALFQRSDGIYIQPSSKNTTGTNNIIKWTIQGNDEINSWLQKRDEYIHPVEYGDWNVPWWEVYNPTYAWAKFDSCEAQYDTQAKAFSLKLSTFLYATGKDENGRPSCVVCIE